MKELSQQTYEVQAFNLLTPIPSLVSGSRNKRSTGFWLESRESGSATGELPALREPTHGALS